MDSEKQLKMIINQILIAKGFYFLNCKTLGQILHLLGKENTCYPAAIRELTIQGLIAFSQDDQLNVQRTFCQPQFQNISTQSKEYLTSIINQVISTKHRFLKNTLQESLVRTIPDVNFPLFTYNGYYPQIGYLNNQNCLGQNIINHGPIHFTPQIQFGNNPIFSQILLNNYLNQDQKIQKQMEEQMQEIKKSKEHNSCVNEVQINRDQAQNRNKHKKDMVNECQNNSRKQQENGQQNIQVHQKYRLSQNACKNADINSSKNSLCNFQIQTDISLILNGQKIKKKKCISKQKETVRVKRKYQKGQIQFLQIPKMQSQAKRSQDKAQQQMQKLHQQANHIQNQLISQNIQNIQDQASYLVEMVDIPEQQQNQESPSQIKQENRQQNQIWVYNNNLSQSQEQINLEVTPFNQGINIGSNVNQFLEDREQQKIELLEINQPIQQDINKTKFQKCICDGNVFSINIFICQKCHNNFHVKCLMDKQDESFHNIECPVCKLRLIDPFQEVLEVVGQFYVKNISQNKFNVKVDLSKYVHLIKNNKSNKYYENEIELRCLRLQRDYQRSEITLPDQVIIYVNGYKVTQTYGLLLTSPNKKRVDQSIIITEQILAYQELDYDQNIFQDIVIEMQYKKLSREELKRKQIDNDHVYLFGVYYIQKVLVADLYKNIVDQIVPFQVNYIKKLFSDGIDEREVIVDFMTCKIRDPYSASLIQLPVRGINCMHVQCFDLKTFISLIWSSKYRLWRCPVCSKEAKQFQLDQKQLQMIKRFEQLKIIPAQLIYLNKGDILLKIQMNEDNEMVQNYNEYYSYENQRVRKTQNYKYFEYFPKVQLFEVTFNSEQCFAARRIIKQKQLQQRQQEIREQLKRGPILAAKRRRRK